jgi:hypothetical protein
MVRTTFMLAGVCLLAGCATQQSYVAPQALNDEQAAVAAYDITTFVATHSKPSDGQVSVTLAAKDTAIAPLLAQYLQQAGYPTVGRTAHHLSYEVTTLDSDTALRIRFDHLTGARLYHTYSGKLEPSGPFSVREDG